MSKSSIRDLVLEKIKIATEKTGIKDKEIKTEHPSDLEFGDYSTNIALRSAKELGKNPMDLAKEIVSNLEEGDLIEKIDIVKPGFINIYLKKEVLIDALKKISSAEIVDGKNKLGRKIVLEFGQPNTHKLPHIGHLFSYIYGESLTRILESEGNKLFRVNYQGDIGLHVAKCLYEVQKNETSLDKLTQLEEKINFLQECYQKGSQTYEQDENSKKEIDEINEKLYRKDGQLYKLWQKTRGLSLEFYKKLEEKLAVRYDKYYFESETSEIGKQIVDKNMEKVFKKSDGAIIFKGEDYGLHNRVFINKYGNPTYEAKDLGLLQEKLKDFPFDLSIVTTASEQNEYWRVVIKASEMIFPEVKGKLKHIGYGLISLAGGKMSSRTGEIAKAHEVISQIEQSIKEKFNLSDYLLVEKVAQAAIKYSFLSSDPLMNIVFDVEKSISKEGNSGPYLLYTYARCQSILKNQVIGKDIALSDPSDEEDKILRKLYFYDEIVDSSAYLYSPHFIANYIFDLAQKFNLFYQRRNILKSEKDTKNFRLALTSAVSRIIKNGLYLLGIETVEKM